MIHYREYEEMPVWRWSDITIWSACEMRHSARSTFPCIFFLSVCSKRSFWLHKFVIFGFLFHVRCHTVIEVYRNARDGAHLGVCVCVLRQTTVTNAISISVPGIATDGGSPKSACFQSNAGGFAWHRSIKKNCVDFTLDG